MRGIRIDPKARVATAQTGVLWGELDRELQAFGLATPGGMISNTGIAGLTLGGGEGWLMGKFGLSVDNVLALDVVSADGQFQRASPEENPDLYWALRGGGGNFGVVTAIEYRVHQHGPAVFGGLIVHPIDRGVEVLRFYRDFSSDLPDEAELFAAVRTLPEVGPVVVLLPGYNGDPQQGRRFFEPVLGFGTPIMSQVGPMPHVARQSYLDGGTAEHGLLRYWKSGYASELTMPSLKSWSRRQGLFLAADRADVLPGAWRSRAGTRRRRLPSACEETSGTLTSSPSGRIRQKPPGTRPGPVRSGGGSNR